MRGYEDGWYLLPNGSAVQVLDGRPVRLSDGGRIRRELDALSLEDAREVLSEFELRLLAEASSAFGLPLSYVSPFDVGTTGAKAFALVEVAPGATHL